MNVIDRFLTELSAGHGMTPDLWQDDTVLDATVPGWRFESHGAEAVAATLSGWYNVPITVEGLSRRPVAGGEVLTLELSWVEDGMPHAAHQAHVLEVDGDRIVTHQAFCGGRWPASLLAEMEAARAH